MPEPTRASMAENGLKCLEQVSDFESNSGDMQTALSDCLANLMHLCDQVMGGNVYGVDPAKNPMDFDTALADAREHFEAEQEE